MKEFLKTTLAVICGMFIMGIIGVFIMLSFVGSLAESADSKPVLPREGVLKMDFSKLEIVEQANADVDIRSMLNSSNVAKVGIWDAVQSINTAAMDPSVKYIYLKPDDISADLAQIEELRSALSNFRLSGKPVISYIEMPTTGSYYLASVSDKVYMSSNAGATPMIVGVGSQMIFLKDLLDKLGVNVQLIRHGKYKSAGEMYIRNSPSPENLEQNQEMVNSIWNSIASEVARSREITVEDFSAMIDNLELNDGEDMLRNKLVDELTDREGLKNKLATFAVAEKFEDVKMISFADYAAVKSTGIVSSKNQIAVVYAEGNIVEGEGNDNSNVYGDAFASTLAKLRNDQNVKAVVLRVASPGGSVLASDKIKTEVDLLRAEKPVIASYGAYAASGGYWISASCDKIFTDNTTLTGSIGCFSMVPDLSGTLKDLLHVGVTEVGSSKHSGMYSMMDSLDEQETEYMQKSIETIYGQFVSIVADGRNLEEEYVDSIAQGRVWTGAEALSRGLVDSIGTLEDAVRYAASAAGNADMSAWSVVGYPKPLSRMEAILAAMNQKTSGNDVLAKTPFKAVGEAFKNWTWESSEHNFARMPYEIVIR